MEYWETLDVLEHNPEKVSGSWVFRGTRVLIAALLKICVMAPPSKSFSNGFLVSNGRK